MRFTSGDDSEDLTDGKPLPGVAGSMIIATIGDGAYGDVKLVREANGTLLAVKVIAGAKAKAHLEAIRREIRLHRDLSHERIVPFIRSYSSVNAEFICLEYMSGGELSDRITPDYGMPEFEAHRLFRQLMEGVDFLHRRGIVHRDIKPENLLLDRHDNLKITDFGFAALFRHNGKVRKVLQRCGTLPYTAPEVFKKKEYDAVPLDVWSCAIVLIAMLTGELPWDKPTENCREFAKYIRGDYMAQTPWPKITNMQLMLLRRMLELAPLKRATVATVMEAKWYSHVGGNSTSPMGPARKRLRVGSGAEPPVPMSTGDHHRYSSGGATDFTENDAAAAQRPPLSSAAATFALQRDNLGAGAALTQQWHGAGPPDSAGGAPSRPAFSQPAQRVDDMLLTMSTSDELRSGAVGDSVLAALVRRMTRFYVKRGVSKEFAIERVRSYCRKMGMEVRVSGNTLVITTKDRRRNDLVFRATAIDGGGPADNIDAPPFDRLFFDFRRSKGDGIEFKRQFVALREALLGEIVNPDPVMWPVHA